VSYYGYDELDRMSSLRADAFGIDATTYYVHDAVGNRTRIDDAESHSTYFAYDELNRLASETDALGKAEYYAYNAVGNVLSRTDGDGQTTYYVYDDLDRLVRIDFPGNESAYFAYDANANLLSAAIPGETTPTYGWGTQPWGTSPYGGQQGSSSGTHIDYFAYDELNRPIRRTIQGVGTLYYAYDLAGRRTMVKDWTDTAVYYEYDKRGLISRVHAPAGWTYYAYDARGAMLTKRLPNDTITYHTYDDAGRVSSIADRRSDGSAICSFAFTRDANGNITRSLREDDSCWYYEYDGLQRLTAAEWKAGGGSSLYAFEYQYDKVGNRVSLVYNGTPTYYSYNAANELTVRETIGDDTLYYAYDGRGNQVKRQTLGGHTQYFAYNARDLVSRVTSTDPSFTPNYFEYNALGERVKITDSTGTTFYVWDGLNITHEHDGTGALKRRYTQGYAATEGIAQMLDLQDLTAPGDPHYFYHFDLPGGVHRLTDAAESVAQSLEFSPNGRTLLKTGTAPNPFMFPGTYLDLPDLPGMPQSKTRIVDTSIGAFLQRDVMERDGLRSRYVYGEDNPNTTVDPAGRQADDTISKRQVIPGQGTATFRLEGYGAKYEYTKKTIRVVDKRGRPAFREQVVKTPIREHEAKRIETLFREATGTLLREARARASQLGGRQGGGRPVGIGTRYRVFLFRKQGGAVVEIGHWEFEYALRYTGKIDPPQESIRVSILLPPTWRARHLDPLKNVRKKQDAPKVTQGSVPTGGIGILARGVRTQVRFTASDARACYYWAQTFRNGVLRSGKVRLELTGPERFDHPQPRSSSAPGALRLQGRTALTATPAFEDRPHVQFPATLPPPTRR
jgi:RHS repeat-associated protein